MCERNALQYPEQKESQKISVNRTKTLYQEHAGLTSAILNATNTFTHVSKHYTAVQLGHIEVWEGKRTVFPAIVQTEQVRGSRILVFRIFLKSVHKIKMEETVDESTIRKFIHRIFRKSNNIG